MASRAYQKLTVRTIIKKNSVPGTRSALDVIAIKRTGYYNLWIDDKHYYCNLKDQKPSVKEVDMHDYFPLPGKKGTIVISKK